MGCGPRGTARGCRRPLASRDPHRARRAGRHGRRADHLSGRGQRQASKRRCRRIDPTPAIGKADPAEKAGTLKLMPLLDQSLVDSVIKRALRSGADFVELFVERKRNQSISVEESKVQRVSSGNDLGAGLRIIHQGTVSYIYTEDLSEDGLLKTADLAAQVGRRGGGRFAFGELVGAPPGRPSSAGRPRKGPPSIR